MFTLGVYGLIHYKPGGNCKGRMSVFIKQLMTIVKLYGQTQQMKNYLSKLSCMIAI